MNTTKNVLVGCLFLGMCACSKLESTTGTNIDLSSNENLTGDISNQPAKISCDLKRNGSSSVARHIDTISGADTFLDSFKEGDSVTYDCSNTQDEEPVDTLSFSIDSNYDPVSPNFVALPGKVFSMDLPTVGRFPMALKVVDAQGKVRIKTFEMVSECLNAVDPVLNVAGVTISPAAKLNFVNYSVNPAAVSGGSGFQFAWDFNGDGSVDPFSMASNNTWTSATSLSNIYTIFATEQVSRNVTLKVKNNCEREAVYTIPVSNLTMHNIDRNPVSLAEEKPYFYMQADLHSLSGSNSQRYNGDLLQTWYPDDQVQRIRCDYHKNRYANNGVFTMKASNWYKDVDSFKHGQQIRVENITDTGAAGLQEITNANLALASYTVSEVDDGQVQEVFDKNSQCTIRMRIYRSQGVTPCAANLRDSADFSDNAAIIIRGEYSCPNLKDAVSGQEVRIDNAKFYCQVAPSNQCVGGGGGGGGNPPPEQ